MIVGLRNHGLTVISFGLPAQVTNGIIIKPAEEFGLVLPAQKLMSHRGVDQVYTIAKRVPYTSSHQKNFRLVTLVQK